MLPIPPRPTKPLPLPPDVLRTAVGNVVSVFNQNPSTMQESQKVLTEATDKDLGDIIADALESVIPYFTGTKIKLVLSLAAKVIRAVL